MDLNTLFTAPAGTPSPLRDAYEAVAEFVHVACTLHQEVARSQTDVNTFVAAACALAGERRKALACLAAAEIWVTATAPDAFAAFHAALEGVEPINHACADVLVAHGMNATDHLGGGFQPCTAYPHHPGSRSDIRSFFSDWPGVNERQLLERMRQPTALAAARLAGLRQAPVPGGGPSQDKALLLTGEGEKPPDLQQNTAYRRAAPKRSTERGEARIKLIAALTKHHQYADGGCLNLEAIGNNDLAKAAGVSASTASTFFNDKFKGHTKYKATCGDSGQLIAALKLLNNEFAPHDLYGRRPADEDDRDDEE
jgi:hypothetical protein